ncbi:outer membrane lipoprotein-sorting protein [bacterium]|nr:outer membrane lipoprotein-sorting protein [bacterium]
MPGLASDTLSARDVMRRVELNQRAPSEIIEIDMTLTDRTGFERRRQVREFRRREPDGLESTLVFFDAPPDIRGSALLSKQRPDGWDDQWLYLPAVGKIRRIADSGRTDYFLGTDLTFEDFSVEDIDLYVYRFAAPDTEIDERPARVIDAVARDESARRRSGYGLRRVYVDADRDVILMTEYFDRSGKLIKILKAAEVERHGSNWRANRIHVRNFQRRHRTDLTVARRDLVTPLAADLFTPRTLRRGSIAGTPARPPETTPETR